MIVPRSAFATCVVSVTNACGPAAKQPTKQVAIDSPTHVAPTVVFAVSANPEGRTSVTVDSVDVDGPRLVVVKV